MFMEVPGKVDLFEQIKQNEVQEMRQGFEDGTSWDDLRKLVSNEDWGAAVSVLLMGLQFESPYDLLPLLNGAIGEVIRKEDEVEVARAQKAAGRSVFSRMQGQLQGDRTVDTQQEEDEGRGQSLPSQAPRQEDIQAAPCRRWRRTLRAMFTVDGAVALQGELLAQFASADFVEQAEKLNKKMGVGDMSYEQKSNAVAALKMGIQSEIIPHYGFAPDQRGLREAQNIIDDMSRRNKELRKMTGKLNMQVLGLFPNLAR